MSRFSLTHEPIRILDSSDVRVRFGETTMYKTITNDGYSEENSYERTGSSYDTNAGRHGEATTPTRNAQYSKSHAPAANLVRHVTNHSPAHASSARPHASNSLKHAPHSSSPNCSGPSTGAHPQTHVVVNVGSPPKAGDKLRASRVLFENRDVNVSENVMEREALGETVSADEEELEVPLMCSVPEHHDMEDRLGLLGYESGDSHIKDKENVRRKVHSSRIRKEHRYGNDV